MTLAVTTSLFQLNPEGMSAELSTYQGLWNGRLFSLVTDSLIKVSKIASQLAYSLLFPLSIVFNDTHATASILKKIKQHVLPVIEYLQDLPNHYTELNIVLESTVAIMNSVQIVLDIDYLANRKFRNDSELIMTGRFFRFIAHLGECLLWLAKDGFIKLEKIAETLGNCPLFNLIKNIPLNVMINSSFAVYHLLFAMNAFLRLQTAENLFQQQFQLIEMAKHAAELTLSSFLIAANPVGFSCLAIASILCIGLEFSSLIYKECHENLL